MLALTRLPSTMKIVLGNHA